MCACRETKQTDTTYFLLLLFFFCFFFFLHSGKKDRDCTSNPPDMQPRKNVDGIHVGYQPRKWGVGLMSESEKGEGVYPPQPASQPTDQPASQLASRPSIHLPSSQPSVHPSTIQPFVSPSVQMLQLKEKKVAITGTKTASRKWPAPDSDRCSSTLPSSR